MTVPTRSITVITGSRAEFGLLKPVMHAIKDRSPHPTRSGHWLTLSTLVTGTHLTKGTWRDVTRAGFTIDAKVRMQKPDQVGPSADVQALGLGITRIGRVLERINPDIVLVLGDRIEALAGACAASVGGYYLAHLHGGDRAQGVADEAMRHAITKLAHLHFPATTQSRRRLIRMGEPSETVFQVGSPAADGLHDIQPAPDAPSLIVIQHPIGAPPEREHRWMTQTLRATAGHDRLILAPNHDPGCQGIRVALQETVVQAIEHWPRDVFLSKLAGAGAIVGNSSAGLIEAAILKIPCVNIGPRQDGREKPGNVIDCTYGLKPVRAAIRRALALDTRRRRHPYGNGETGQSIADVLSRIDLRQVSKRKQNSY